MTAASEGSLCAGRSRSGRGSARNGAIQSLDHDIQLWRVRGPRTGALLDGRLADIKARLVTTPGLRRHVPRLIRTQATIASTPGALCVRGACVSHPEFGLEHISRILARIAPLAPAA